MRRHIPNMITCCNLICGCIATGAAFHNHFSTTLIFILLGACFDFFDGMVARKLGVSGPMGVELDSLADAITFGVAPGAMVFVLFSQVYYPSFMYGPFWFNILPYRAFLIPAFSALRLAKFNIDTRQHETFIGMPTPANALFWAGLLVGAKVFLTSPMFNSLWLFLFVIMFCWLLVSEIPMFSLKFNHHDGDNRLRIMFIVLCGSIMLLFVLLGEGSILQLLSRGLASCIGLYLIISIVRLKWVS